MALCPIAHWKQQYPNALAFRSITYEQFDDLIQRLCASLVSIPENILAFIPEKKPLDLAFLFAAWRMGKAVYPLSVYLPKKAILKRLKMTGAFFINPSQLSLDSRISISEINLNHLATLIETSTCTKIACHTYNSHLISTKAVIEALSFKTKDTFCLNLPLFHISGIALSLRCFLAGGTLLFPENQNEATHLSLVPTQIFRLVREKYVLPKVKSLLVGGAPLTKRLYEEALELSLPIYTCYGMTETASMVALKPPNCPTMILPHVELKLSPDREILLRGPSLLNCYWGEKERNEKDWFATKDIGQLSVDKGLEIIGRKDRQFISGGENIHPEEIEQALLQFPEVIEAKVQPRPCLEFGMRPIATLYCRKKISLDFIRKKLEKLLPRYKIPQEISIATEPMKNSKLTQLSEH